jgi:hypothetical protein
MLNYNFYTYSDGQIKQRHNTKMLYNTYLQAVHNYNLRFRYKMLWQKHQGGYQLLVKQNMRTNKREYLGRRDVLTEQIASDFIVSKKEAKERVKSLKAKLTKNAKINKIEGIARTPKELVKIFRKINELGLDDKLIVIGTNALYAYEAKAGVGIEEEYLATDDIDILNRKDKGLSFIFKELHSPLNALDFLHLIDKSFYQHEKRPYRFINKDAVWIELINPVSDSVTFPLLKDNLFRDLTPLAMNGIQWLENSRLFKETIIGTNGESANMTTIHPLEFVIYKNWLSQQDNRELDKQRRDRGQSRLITKLIVEYMPNIEIEEELKGLKHLKKEIVDGYREDILRREINF